MPRLRFGQPAVEALKVVRRIRTAEEVGSIPIYGSSVLVPEDALHNVPYGVDMSTMEQPLCQHQRADDEPICGLPMFRIGTEAHWAFVCAVCDANYVPQNSLDSPGRDV